MRRSWFTSAVASQINKQTNKQTHSVKSVISKFASRTVTYKALSQHNVCSAESIVMIMTINFGDSKPVSSHFFIDLFVLGRLQLGVIS